MEKCLPLEEDVNSLNDEQLFEKFSSEIMIRKAKYFAVLASRLPKFKALLFEEAVNENMDIPLFIIKGPPIMLSWFPVIAILDYANDDITKHEIASHIKKHWTSEDYANFKDYIKSSPDFIKYFE